MENRYYVMCVIIKNMFPDDEEFCKKWPVGMIMHVQMKPYKIYENALKRATKFNEKNSSCKAYITDVKGQKIWMPNEVQELFRRSDKL